jgi:hypothetical protein
MKRVYIASSGTRNAFYVPTVARMRAAGYSVFDWSSPGLNLEAIDPNYRDWTLTEYIVSRRHPAIRDHFDKICKAITEADICVLLLPAGTDAHCEAVLGSVFGKPVIVCFADGRPQPELIHCKFWLFTDSIDGLMAEVAAVLADPAAYYRRNPSLHSLSRRQRNDSLV